MTKTWKAATAALAGAALLGVGMVIGGVAANGASPAAKPSASPSAALPPLIAACDAEDGSGPKPCIWDARTRGNGKGRSFVSPEGSADGPVIYLD